MLPRLARRRFPRRWKPRRGARAAYRLALALGNCRLFGVSIDEELNEPCRPISLAASRELTRLLKVFSAEAEQLGRRWDAAVDPAEADNWCSSLLDMRMDAWAAGIALAESYQACRDDQHLQTAGLHQAIDQMQLELNHLDEQLLEEAEILATIISTRLLKTGVLAW